VIGIELHYRITIGEHLIEIAGNLSHIDVIEQDV
jgi:hypothetical protein